MLSVAIDKMEITIVFSKKLFCKKDLNQLENNVFAILDSKKLVFLVLLQVLEDGVSMTHLSQK